MSFAAMIPVSNRPDLCPLPAPIEVVVSACIRHGEDILTAAQKGMSQSLQF